MKWVEFVPNTDRCVALLGSELSDRITGMAVGAEGCTLGTEEGCEEGRAEGRREG